jgi:hypothetical protein
MLPTGDLHPLAERALRDLARKPARASAHPLGLAVANMLARTRGAPLSSQAIKRLTAEVVEGLEWDREVAWAVTSKGGRHP